MRWLVFFPRWAMWAALAAAAVGTFASPRRAPAAGSQRIDFDERLIKGQTAKAGGVYIFDRKQVEGHSLVRRSRSFRKRIILTVFEEGTGKER